LRGITADTALRLAKYFGTVLAQSPGPLWPRPGGGSRALDQTDAIEPLKAGW